MKTLSKLAAGLVMAAAGAAAVVLPALPAAASSGCDFTMVSLKARNLHHSTDYVWVKVDGTWFPAGNNGVAFNLGDTHYASAFGNPYMGFGNSGVDVSVVLDEWPSNYYVETKTIACSPVTNKTITFERGGGATMYDMTYTVT